MMSWMKSQASGSIERKKVEPAATYSLFENHWAQALQVMRSVDDSEGALIVISHLSQMISFLGMTRGESITSEISCKAFWLQHRCSDEVIRWLHTLQIKGMQMPDEDEVKLVAMLHSLCEAASRDGELLGYVRMPTKEVGNDSWDGAYSLASLLLEYSLRNTVALAETARYSFIQLIQLAAKFPGLERSLSQESGLGLTNVVVSGLSACFAQLPTFTKASPAQLNPFIEQLKFVDDVTHAASETVATTISECFTNAFLSAVIEPSLTQSLNEEIGIVTFYLEIVCRNVTHPTLVKSLVHFINKKLLNTLIHRLSTNESVSVIVSTLSLFNVLLEFYCEDFWIEVILKYLTPQQHLIVSQRRLRLPNIEFYDSSARFLSLIPIAVCEVLGSATIESNFIQYVNHASTRWRVFDSTVGTTLSITRSAEMKDNQPMDGVTCDHNVEHLNPVFPKWKYNYDGAESGMDRTNGMIWKNENFASHSCKPGDGVMSNISRFSDVGIGRSESSDPLNSPLSSDTLDFTTINLQHGSVEELHPTDSSRRHTIQNGNSKFERFSFVTNQSDGYASMESGESPLVQENDASATTVASFGPFVDNLFVQLSNWPHLDLNVILMLTEVVSLLAACRIPLVNSLLLDPTLTLQPYYVTFNTLLKRIREDLDYQLKDVSRDVIGSVWEAMSFKNDETSNRLQSGYSGGTLGLAVSPSFSNQLGDTIRKTIASGGAEAIANVWKRFNRKSTSPSPKVQVHPSAGTLLKVGNGVQGSSPLESPDASKIMVMRMIFFAHWLMELGAIAQQLCWKPAYD